MAMDFKLGESATEYVRSQLGYITSYKSNQEKLIIEVQNLKGRKSSVQETVDEAKRNGEKILNNVQIWLKKVDETIAEANNLIFNDFQENYPIHIPNIQFRLQHSKKLQKMTQEIYRVLSEGNFDKISKPPTIKEIQQVLKDPNICKIGLYGIDGVGKTTLMKELAKEVLKDGSFDVVAMAEVTDSPNVENIQGQIADALALKFDEETKEERMQKLRGRISKEKNILVILDDIWGQVDLAELGIPFGDDHKGCKLLLTSERLNVLKRQMGTQNNFRLEVLSDEDSWKLFEKIADQAIKSISTNKSVVELDEINSIVQNVPKCCNGFPLFIVVVAKALRTKDLSTWKDALKQLKGMNEKGHFEKVVCPLELGYRYLESDELRTLFLFIVSLGPGRIHTGELFSCYWGLYGDSHQLTKARNNYYKFIDDLRASSLLLEVEIEYVRMHDSVRDTAKAISSRTHLTYEVPKFTQKEQWDIDQLKKCHYINLPCYSLDEVPKKLDCPELKQMSLKSNLGQLTIPDNFFAGMGEVKVLNLHRMSFAPSPPPSFRLLKNLRSLNLYECVLDDITMVAELTSLEILSLERSKLQELPKEIGQLTRLRMLNLTNCYQLKSVPRYLIYSLVYLEELYMGNCNIQWEAEGVESQSNNPSLGELRKLDRLTTLDLSIHDASVLPTDMDVFKQLQRYNISIGNMWKWSSFWSCDAREISTTLKLVDSLNTEIFLNHGIQMLFTTIKDLSLAKINFSDDVFYELNREAFQHLRHLYVQNSDAFYNLETLILCDLRNMYGPFAKQTLILWNLHNLEDISYGPLAAQCFENLQVFKVQGCCKLKKLLSYSVAKNLAQLQHMEIFDCTAMEEIVCEEKLEDENLHNITDNAIHCFEKLRVIKVHGCHKLKKLLPYSLAKKLSQLQEMEIVNCTVMEEIIYEDENLHNMKDTDTLFFYKLQIIKVHGCHKLKILLPYSLAKNLSQLQEIEIFDCTDMEEIISEKKIEDENLHNVKDIGTHVFEKLQVLKVQGCYKLKILLPYSLAKNLSQLQEMEIFDCTNMEEIISKEKFENENLNHMEDIGTQFFENLQVINVQSCYKLKKLLPYALAKNLSQLQEMKISHCNVLEEIISEEKFEDGKEFPMIVLPKLHSLTLDTLPNLCSFSLPLEIDKDDGSISLPLFNQKVINTLFILHCLMFLCNVNIELLQVSSKRILCTLSLTLTQVSM